MQRDIGIQ